MKIWHYVVLIALIFIVGVFGFAHWIREDEALTQQAQEKMKSDLFYNPKLNSILIICSWV